MRNKANKTLLTIGDVARICQVAPRTASGWVDRGLLQGFRIPGGLDRRVRTQDLRDAILEIAHRSDRIEMQMTRLDLY